MGRKKEGKERNEKRMKKKMLNRCVVLSMIFNLQCQRRIASGKGKIEMFINPSVLGFRMADKAGK